MRVAQTSRRLQFTARETIVFELRAENQVKAITDEGDVILHEQTDLPFRRPGIIDTDRQTTCQVVPRNAKPATPDQFMAREPPQIL